MRGEALPLHRAEWRFLDLLAVGRFRYLLGLCVWLAAGCTSSISVDPSCPSEMQVGESATLQANEHNPGAIPTYEWEAMPADTVTLESPTEPVTKIEALKVGEVVVRLTASDSLYQTVSECRVVVVEAGKVEVSLLIDPNPIAVGASTVLFCSSTGETEAVRRTLEQVEGPTVALELLSEGVATITPDQPGELTFTCVGEAESGTASEPSEATLTVEDSSDDSDNGNTNDNDNRGGRSGRGGRG